MKNPGIYILTNNINLKRYVGQDSNLPNRPNTHLRCDAPACRYIHNAIQKYGRDNFSVEIIHYPGISREALNEVEKWKIDQLCTKTPHGYNLTDGGEGLSGYNHTPETREKISKTHKISKDHLYLDPEWQEKYNPFFNSEWQKIHGMHNFCSSEWQRRVRPRRDYSMRMTMKSRRRQLYRIFSALLTSQSVMEEYNKRRLHRIEVPYYGDPVQLQFLDYE